MVRRRGAGTPVGQTPGEQRISVSRTDARITATTVTVDTCDTWIPTACNESQGISVRRSGQNAGYNGCNELAGCSIADASCRQPRTLSITSERRQRHSPAPSLPPLRSLWPASSHPLYPRWAATDGRSREPAGLIASRSGRLPLGSDRPRADRLAPSLLRRPPGHLPAGDTRPPLAGRLIVAGADRLTPAGHRLIVPRSSRLIDRPPADRLRVPGWPLFT